MKNKKIYIITGVVVAIIIIFLATKAKVSAPSSLEETTGEEVVEDSGVPSGSPKATGPVKSSSVQPVIAKPISALSGTTDFPEIEFIDERLTFRLNDFPDVKITIEKVAFGRGDAAISTGCTGIPNANFSAYLYPGSGICVSAEKVDNSPRGIMAFHLLIENNGNIGFGGIETFLLHYLRSDSEGTPSHQFAHPLSSLREYYIRGYSSREIILSYLVPEDQLVYELVSGYKGPDLENKTFNIYDLSDNGIFVDFGSKDLKIIK